MSVLIRGFLGSALVSIPFSISQVSEVNAQDLQSFGVIAGQSLTNTGPTTIDGNIAVGPGTSYTGSGSVTQTNGTTYIGDAVAGRIQNDLTTLYNALAGRPTTVDLTGQDLGSMTLTAGVYNFDSSAGIGPGQTLTLDAGGDPNAIFIFNIASTLTAESASSVILTNGAQAGNVFYRVGSSATLDTSSELVGQIVALTSITMNTAAELSCGAAYARNGSVTLDSNTIQICTLAGSGFDTVDDNPLLTENERTISRTLSDYVADGGILPIGFAILAATQDPEELALSLAQMSGEVANSVAPTGMQSMAGFLDVVMGSRPSPSARVRAAPRDQGVPAGMVPDRSGAYTGKYGPAEPDSNTQSLASSSTLTEQSRPWDVWASGYGSRSMIDGNTSIGSQDLTSADSGFAVGLNLSQGEGSEVGIAFSWNKADFTLNNGFGNGSNGTLFAALHGRSSTDLGYLEGAIAYGKSDITTNRTVTIAGTDQLIGETTADNLAAHIEAGYHMGIFTPFAGLRAQSFTTNAYSEAAVSGSSSYALEYDKNTTTALRSELGVDVQILRDIALGGTTQYGLRAAWAHEFASNEAGTRSFLSIPDAAFSVSGATKDSDSVLLAASAGKAASNGLYVDAALNAEFSGNSQDVGGTFSVGYSW